MSEEGGFEEVEESFRAAASCSCKWATTACKASSCWRRESTWACSRSQFAQGVEDGCSMLPVLLSQPPCGTLSVNGYHDAVEIVRFVVALRRCYFPVAIFLRVSASTSASLTGTPPRALLWWAASMNAKISIVSSGLTGDLPVRTNFAISMATPLYPMYSP